jgi:vacuolar-type H+-ATPase subunit E/Vma4
MDRCANTEALNRYEREQEKAEKQSEQAIKEFRESMEDAIDHVLSSFNYQAKHSMINRSELRAILLEDIEEQL